MSQLWDKLRAGTKASKEDIARAIGEQQLQLNRVPLELNAILANVAAQTGVALNV